MYPKHSSLEKQQGQAPYTITLSSATYRPGQNITITVSADDGRVIRGIQTNARRTDVNRNDIVGTFVDWPDSKVKVLSCFLSSNAETVNTSFAPIDWNGYTFEILGEGEGYISLGFSYDKKMGDDQTLSCTAQGDRVTVQNGYNHKGLWNEWQQGMELRNLQTKQEDGKIYCRFTRPESMDVVYYHAPYDPPEIFTFDLQIDFYVFIAWGYTYQDTDVMRIHQEMPVISDNKINFRRFDVYRGVRACVCNLSQLFARKGYSCYETHFTAVALLLAFQWEWEPRVMREMGVTVVGVWIAVQIVEEILLEIRRCCFARRTEAVDINLDNDPTEKQEVRRNPSSLPIILYLLVPLAAGSAGLCCILLF
nr:hypothetical protein BaRGS_029421 [Batillaria attramentaria]